VKITYLLGFMVSLIKWRITRIILTLKFWKITSRKQCKFWGSLFSAIWLATIKSNGCTWSFTYQRTRRNQEIWKSECAILWYTDVNFGGAYSQQSDELRSNAMVVPGPSLTRGPGANRKNENQSVWSRCISYPNLGVVNSSRTYGLLGGITYY
jgi:hypothetical protein